MQPNAEIIKLLGRISNTTGRNLDEVFKSFLTLSFCTLSLGQRETVYRDEAGRWKRDQLIMFREAFHALYTEMETHPYEDLLGDIHMQLLSPKSKQYSGEYYTPHHVCLMMAKIILGEEPKEKIVTVLEPACGSGRMILACAETFAKDFNRPPTGLRVQAWDTSLTAVMMTFINTSLWGIPCRVIHGDTLRVKVHAQYPNLLTVLYPFPRRATQDTSEEDEAKEPTINLGKGHEQTSLFDLDEAA